jgi:hypothetical protein
MSTMTWWSSSCFKPDTTMVPTSGSTPCTRTGNPPPWIAYCSAPRQSRNERLWFDMRKVVSRRLRWRQSVRECLGATSSGGWRCSCQSGRRSSACARPSGGCPAETLRRRPRKSTVRGSTDTPSASARSGGGMICGIARSSHGEGSTDAPADHLPQP